MNFPGWRRGDPAGHCPGVGNGQSTSEECDPSTRVKDEHWNDANKPASNAVRGTSSEQTRKFIRRNATRARRGLQNGREESSPDNADAVAGLTRERLAERSARRGHALGRPPRAPGPFLIEMKFRHCSSETLELIHSFPAVGSTISFSRLFMRKLQCP